ncbi:holo-ACP synthase [Leucobacter luti]|nr:holo-ACP synthase [Leucobacter luti]
MIMGIGVDTVDIARFERQLERVPALRARLFTPAERELPAASLAARFAAKEALIKALGGSDGVSWQDLEVLRGPDRAPGFVETVGLTAALGARGAHRAHLSMTHDAGIATAFVVVERLSGAEYAQGTASNDETGQ